MAPQIILTGDPAENRASPLISISSGIWHPGERMSDEVARPTAWRGPNRAKIKIAIEPSLKASVNGDEQHRNTGNNGISAISIGVTEWRNEHISRGGHGISLHRSIRNERRKRFIEASFDEARRVDENSENDFRQWPAQACVYPASWRPLNLCSHSSTITRPSSMITVLSVA